MGSKKGSKKTWYDYHLSQHLAYCHGPVDEVVAIYMKDKLVWQGSATGGSVIEVNNPDLFGGNEREGGVAGNIHVLNGADDQEVPETFAQRLGKTVANCPGFRGIFSLLLLGGPVNGRNGFLVSSNYPSVPGVDVRIRRYSTALGGPHAVIQHNGSFGLQNDSNPAHIIYECLVNEEWGMACPPSLINSSTFLAAASTLFDEAFGLSMLWVRQATIREFVQEVLDHIQGFLYFNPKSGLVELSLLREDYDKTNLPEIGPDNARLDNYRRQLWGETVNEVVVSWTNPATEESETVAVQDLGNFQMQGTIISESRDYYGIRNADLAARVAARDVRSAAIPLASAVVYLNRQFWDILPGEVYFFTWPEHGIEKIIMRVMDVDYGKPDDAEMKVTLLEDVFGISVAQFIAPDTPPDSEWEDPGKDPNGGDGIDFYDLETVFTSAPPTIIQRVAGSDELSDDRYPEIVPLSFVTKKNDQQDLQSYVKHRRMNDAAGNSVFLSVGEKTLVNYTELLTNLPREVESTILAGQVWSYGEGPEVGGYGVISNRDEFLHEVVLVTENLGGGTFRLARGIYDTVPREWNTGTRIYWVGTSYNGYDLSSPIADTNIDYLLQARTSVGLTDLGLVPVKQTRHPARPYMPYRAANMRMDGILFADRDQTTNYEPRVWTIEYTWSNRNRLTEDSVARRWDEGNVVMETDQTIDALVTRYPVRFDPTPNPQDPDNPLQEELDNYPVNGNFNSIVLASSLNNDSSVTSYTLDLFQTGRYEALYFYTCSKRSGFINLQSDELRERMYPKGYGSDYGYFWGGWPADNE